MTIGDENEVGGMLDSSEVKMAEVSVAEPNAIVIPKDILEEPIELASHLVTRIISYRTFKVSSDILGEEVHNLIDSSTSHNFISNKLVKILICL